MLSSTGFTSHLQTGGGADVRSYAYSMDSGEIVGVLSEGPYISRVRYFHSQTEDEYVESDSLILKEDLNGLL